MNELRYEEKIYWCSKIKGESSVPSLEMALNIQNKKKNILSEDEGLFIGYGKANNSFPYKKQNVYGELEEVKTKVAILENDYMKATFLIEQGGRLWELIDKESSQNLLYTNDVMRMRNLSIRNAWFSGGVEWNVGSIGHSPFTCSKLYVAELNDESGNKILRMYEFERLRRVTYQIDFWLEKNKLLCRVRIDNKNEKVVPMYWWSNIAVPENEGGRVIAPAHSAYKNSEQTGVSKVSIPVDDERDVTFYNDITNAVDYFFDIDYNQRKFIANVDNNGFGLLHCSSRALKGRKLFCWGHIQGSHNWQSFLTEKSGDYIEIQAGYAKTQYECVPMPPKTVWEWIECYTKLDVDANEVMGDYDKAVETVDKMVENIFIENDLDKLVTDTKEMAKTKADLKYKGNGFGFIENLIAKNKTADHLEFTEDNYLNDWKELIINGDLKEISDYETPKAFVIGDDFKELLIKSSENKGKDNWYVWYQLGVMQYNDGELKSAILSLTESILINSNEWNNHAIAFARYKMNDKNAYRYALRAIEINPKEYSVVESLLKLLLDCKNFNEILMIKDIICEDVINNRIRMYFAFAYINTGCIEKAEQILYKDGGLVITDMREGESSIGDLWEQIRQAKEPKYVIGHDEMPKIFDFRMS